MDSALELASVLHNGIEFTSADDISTYELATLNTSLAAYARLRQVPGPLKRSKIVFGKENPLTNVPQYPTISVTDDGSTGSASLKLFTLPQGWVQILNVRVALSFTTTAAWAPTTPVVSIGTAAAGNNATLTGTEADIIASTSLTITSGASTFAASYKSANSPFTDNSGGTASTTLAAISGTYTQSEVRNSVASLAAAANDLKGSKILALDGSSAAKDIYLNFACNSDPSSGKTIIPAGYVLLDWRFLGSAA